MRVILKHNWFVEGHRVRRSVSRHDPVYVPDRLRDVLPTSAVIVSDDYEAPKGPKEASTTTLSRMTRASTAPRSMVDFLNRDNRDPGALDEWTPPVKIETEAEPEAEPEVDPVARAQEVLASTTPRPGRKGK